MNKELLSFLFKEKISLKRRKTVFFFLLLKFTLEIRKILNEYFFEKKKK